jgi:hypothetical protein
MEDALATYPPLNTLILTDLIENFEPKKPAGYSCGCRCGSAA